MEKVLISMIIGTVGKVCTMVATFPSFTDADYIKTDSSVNKKVVSDETSVSVGATLVGAGVAS